VRLKDFQKDSVEAIVDGLENPKQRGVYALADEVGLGKTLVCAEVARRLILASPDEDRFVIYYVAPSIELLDQNLKSIASHLERELGGGFKVHRTISRISKIPLDLSEFDTNARNVFVIGLSPATSFKVSGSGLMSERAYLAGLFGLNCQEEWKTRLKKIFWAMKRPMKPGFAEAMLSYKHFGSLIKWRFEENGECAVFTRRLREVDTERPDVDVVRKLIAEIRGKIVSYLINMPEALPKFVIFDEWHKYKDTCFEPEPGTPAHNRLVADLLAAVRDAPDSKVLFVSATPFTVDYKDADKETMSPTSSDLKSLIRLFWHEDQFLVEYWKLEAKQRAFVSSIGALLGHANGEHLEAARDAARNCAKLYEKELRRYCVRTERPRAELADDEVRKMPGWSEAMFASGSAAQFIRQFGQRQSNPVRSPVTAMWMDGHTFPSAGYDGLAGLKIKNLRKQHWKIVQLEDLLRASFSYRDRLHSFHRPPLWLPPEEPLQGRKQLIFSEFRFVPDEICEQLKKQGFGTTRGKPSGSVLGVFPSVVGREKRTASRDQLQGSIYFPFFYPFLFWELEPAEQAKILFDHKAAIKDRIRLGGNAVSLMLDIDGMLIRGTPLTGSGHHRQRVMDLTSDIEASPRFQEFMNALLFEKTGRSAPGKAAAGVIKGQRARHLSKGKPVQFEAAAVGLAQSIFHLFASPEAQLLEQAAVIPARAGLPKRWKAMLRFSLWYSRKNRLAETLLDFSALLEPASQDGLHVLTDIAGAMSLRRGSVGTRFVRSFHDRKINDAKGDQTATANAKSIRAAFNSPFPPYVLASTSVGQEGLDFHRYCDSIIHWTPPSSPSILRQRNGRLDRFRSLQVRIAKETVVDGTQSPDSSYRELSPDFVVMRGKQRVNRPKIQVWYLPYTSQHAAWKRCCERMHYDDLLIGAPDPLADERAWLEVIDRHEAEERARRLQILREFSISLRPKIRNLK